MKQFIYCLQKLFSDIFNILKALVAIPLFSSYSCVRKTTNVEDCLTVVGNGPSAKLVIDKCAKESCPERGDIMVVNFFGSDDSLFIVKPKHYLIIDSGFYENKIDHVKDKYNALVENLKKVNWPMNFYIPNHRRETIFIKEIIQNKYINICFVNTTPVDGPLWFRNFIYKKQLGMALCANVINAALFIGINSGYKNINVYGIEHSWLQLLFHDEHGYLCTRQSHFYKDDQITRLPKGSLGVSLQQIANCLKSYQLCEDYARSVGCHIINFTPNSFVDVFDIK